MTFFHSVEALPADSGAYVLWIRLTEATELKIGRLDKITLIPGVYTYTGRASRNLRARLRRHLSREKKIRWHVDKLLAAGAEISRIWVYARHPEWECRINQLLKALPDASVPIPGFGSSDCTSGCPAHLLGHPKIASAEKLELQPDWIVLPQQDKEVNFTTQQNKTEKQEIK